MRDELEKLIIKNWTNIFPDIDFPQNISFLLKSGFRKDIVIVFSDSNTLPFGFGYLTDNEKIMERFLRQFEILSKINNTASQSLQDSVPKPLIWEKVGIYWFLLLNVVSGLPMVQFITKNKMPYEHLTKAFEWLIKFQKEFNENTIPLTEIVNKRQLDNQLGDIIIECKDCPVPLVLKHGDFQPSNILFDKNKLYVVDWEYGEIGGLPLYDLYHLLINFYRRSKVQGKRIRSVSRMIDTVEKNINIPDHDNFKEVFFSKGDYTKIAKKMVLDYCQALNIDKLLARPLFYLFIAEYMGKKFMEDFLNKKDNFIVSD